LRAQDVLKEGHRIEPLERRAAQPSVVEVVAIDVDGGLVDGASVWLVWT
jgi:hypothetical protein